MAPSPNLVNATAVQRLAAKALDALPSAALIVAATLLLSLAGGAEARALGLGTGAVLAAGYGLWLWFWEAATGKTPGNLAMGIRTTGQDGRAPGVLPVLLRNVIIGVSGVVAVGPVIMLISNVWDRNHQRQGWHDKAAGTLVVDVRAGRNPLLTGGITPVAAAPGAAGGQPATATAAAAESVAPATNAPPVSSAPVSSAPITSVPVNAVPGYSTPPASRSIQTGPPAPATGFTPGFSPAAGAGTAVVSGGAPASAAAPVPAPAETIRPAAAPEAGQPAPHPDDDLAMTRVASRRRFSGMRLMFDDGSTVVVTGTALLGRNPAAKPEENADQLLDFADMGRSVSKTHLHLQADPNGVWVTDRNSTNGSAVLTAQGLRENLEPMRPVLAPSGSTVFFGDRSFTVSPV